MMLIGNDLRVLVATQPIDFRAGINRLVSLISQSLGGDPYGGQLYVFRSKRNDRLRRSVLTGRVWCWRRNGWKPAVSIGLRSAMV